VGGGGEGGGGGGGVWCGSGVGKGEGTKDEGHAQFPPSRNSLRMKGGD